MSWTYEQWNEYLCDRLFSWDHADSLIYVLLDDDDLADAAAAMGVGPEDVLSDLARAIRSKMRLNGSHDGMFGWFTSQVQFWRLDVSGAAKEDELRLPPVVGLLALCSEAAKEMGASGMSPNYFYGPLAALLALDAQDRTVLGRLANSYRAVVQSAWDCVEQWCEENEGQRGIISVKSTSSFPYVGLAVSQALVRQHDRRHLPDFFRQYRLGATSTSEPNEVEAALTEWLDSPSSSASRNFRTVWRNKSARPRALEIVMRELEQWTGAPQPGGAPRLILEASLSTFPRLSISWSLMIENTESEEPVAATLRIGQLARDVEMQPTLDAELYVELRSEVLSPNANLMFTRTDIDLANGTSVARSPKRLVLLAKNPVTGRYEETPRIPLGESCIVVVNGPIDAEAVRRLVHEHADTGWRESVLNSDIADGGTAFTNVRITAQGFRTSADWLQPMSPREKSALSIEGGLALGRQAWLLSRPPTIVATVAGGVPYAVKLLRIDEEQASIDVSGSGLRAADLGVRIAGEALLPGRYRIELQSTTSGEVLRKANLRLVTSDTVDVRSWRRSSRLARDFTAQGAFAAVTAAPISAQPGLIVEGAHVSEDTASVRATVAGPTTLSAWWTNEAAVERQIARRIDETSDSPVDWADALEALLYLGGGAATALTSIARQVMPSEEFAAWRFWRACSDLGHIEVALDRGLAPRAWRLVRPQLAGTVDGNWLLCGYWPRKAVERLSTALPTPLHSAVSHHGPQSLLTDALPVGTVKRVIQQLGIDANVIPDAAAHLLNVLPNIATLTDSLPSTFLPDFEVIHRFEVDTRRYERVERINRTGAYRASTRGMQRFIVVTPEDLHERRCHFADADLAKHVAAAMTGRPYVAYHPGQRYLVTPFGIRLPHLYGRVATLCSGRLSRTLHNSWTIYEGVSADIAEALHARMKWEDSK